MYTLAGFPNLTVPSGGSRRGARGPCLPPLFGVKKAEMTEEKNAGRASGTKPPPYPSLLPHSP